MKAYRKTCRLFQTSVIKMLTFPCMLKKPLPDVTQSFLTNKDSLLHQPPAAAAQPTEGASEAIEMPPGFLFKVQT